MGNGHMEPNPAPPPRGQTDMTESITFPQLHWRSAMNTSNNIRRILNCLQFRDICLINLSGVSRGRSEPPSHHQRNKFFLILRVFHRYWQTMALMSATPLPRKILDPSLNLVLYIVIGCTVLDEFRSFSKHLEM